MVAFVAVAFPTMTRLPLIVEEAETRIPRVVVGRREPATIDQSRNCEL